MADQNLAETTTHGNELLALGERVAMACGPDREIDCRVWLVVGDVLGSTEYSPRNPLPMKPSCISNGRWMGSALEKYPDDISGIARSWRVPLFTSSLDAAMALVPEGWSRSTSNENGYEEVTLNNHGLKRTAWAHAATPALALTAAALRAHAAQEPR